VALQVTSVAKALKRRLYYKYLNQSCKPVYGDYVHHGLVNIEFYNIQVDSVRMKIDFNSLQLLSKL
jgi:hypothetical protein